MAAPVNRPRSHTGAGLALVGILVLAVVALVSVLHTRYDTGEGYPGYSSLRADPLGTRGLFESLGRIPGVTSVRNFERLDKLQGAPRQTLLLCGLDARSFDTGGDLDTKALARFAAAGGRLVITLSPSGETNRMERAIHRASDELDEEDKEDKKAREKEAKEKKAKPDTKDAETKPETKDTQPESAPKDEPEETKKKDKKNKRSKHSESSESLSSLLKISAKSREFFFMGKEGSPLKLKEDAPLSENETPSWFSNVFLDDDPAQNWRAHWDDLSDTTNKPAEASNNDSAKPAAKKKKKDVPIEPSPWHVIATKGDRNMIMERSMGAGSVVVCTDRYFLSNEALWKGAKTKFLGWLLGDASRITFEETHLGAMVGDEDGIMTLARRYRMHGLFLGGILLFALYIWRNSVSLVPPNPEDDLGHWRADAVAGQSTASGLEGLLRRGISPSRLLTRCLDVWEGTKAAAATVPAERRALARALLEQFKSQRQAPQAYSQIRDALHPPRSESPSRPPPSANP